MASVEQNKFINDVLKIACKKLGYEDYEFTLQPGNKKGEGYLGEIFFLDVKEKHSNDYKSIIIKRSLQNEIVRSTTPIRRAFLNEINFYTNIVPTLRQFAQEINIPVLDNIPKCYLTSVEEGNEYLVMENLKPLGYAVHSKKEIVSYEQIEMIWKSYARLHATSVLYRVLRPEGYKKLVAEVLEVMNEFFHNEQFTKLSGDMMAITAKKLIPGEDDKAIAEFEKYKTRMIELLDEAIIYHGQNPVLCHGDCWSNNMLFCYNEDKSLKDMKLIDWQIVKQGSIVHDLSYSLYSGASTETFDRIDELLDTYYEEFSSMFRKAGQNAEKILPLSVIKEEWTLYSRYGLIMGIMIVNGKTTDDENLVDLTDMGEDEFSDEVVQKIMNGMDSKEFSTRVRDILLHVSKMGAL